MNWPRLIAFSVPTAEASAARTLAYRYPTIAIDASSATMARTTRSSIKVKPESERRTSLSLIDALPSGTAGVIELLKDPAAAARRHRRFGRRHPREVVINRARRGQCQCAMAGHADAERRRRHVVVGPRRRAVAVGRR